MLPAGLLVEAPVDAIAARFSDIAPLQPVAMSLEGIVCAPRCAPEIARPALARCPFPTRALTRIPGWPDPPSAMVAGWYRRSLDHLPAPDGVRELIQVVGEGFGPVGHATSAMCLEALERLPQGPALDAGCGSGLLTQAWVALGRGGVLACELDARALDHAHRSLTAGNRRASVVLRHGPIATLTSTEISGRVILANIPLDAHRSLLARIGAPPPAAVLSGLRPQQTARVVDAYRDLGLGIVSSDEREGFTCTTLMLV